MDTSTTAPVRTRTGAGSSNLTERVRSLKLSDQQLRRRGTTRLAWTCAVILALATGFLGFREYQRGDLFAPQARATSAQPSTSAPADPVAKTNDQDGKKEGKAAPQAVPDSGEIALESKGYLIPAHQILVSPKVSGMVTKLFIEEGMRIEKGQVLGELEKVDYESDLARTKATLSLALARRALIEAGTREEEKAQSKAEYDEANRQLQQLRSEHERNISLRNRDKKLVSDSEFEEQNSQYEAAIKKVERLEAKWNQMKNGNRQEEKDAARAEVAQAEADVIKAEWRLSNCTIKAPISGTVLKKNAEEGNIVNPVAFNGSFSLCDLADLSDLEVDLSIQERDVSKVYLRQACQIRSEAYPERIYEGFVDRLMPIADRAKGAIPVRVKVKVDKSEEGIYLKPDMSAVVTFLNRKVSEPPRSSAPKKTDS